MIAQTEVSAKWEAFLIEWERIADQIKEFAAALVETVGPVYKEAIERLHVVYEGLQRVQLLTVLMRRWHIPYIMADWLSRRWPRRWLPKLKPELWEWDEGETE